MRPDHDTSKPSVFARRLRAFRHALAAVFPPLASRQPARTAQWDEIRLMIRLGFFDEAEAILNAAAGDRLCDPDALNLLGFIAESRRSWTTARQWYGKALRADPAHTAAQHNLRRLYEMQTFGRGDSQRASFGDEHPALNELLNARRADPVDADAAPPPTPPPCEHSGITPVH